MADMFDLTGRVALVTGASRGIGEAIAKAFAQQCARVVVSSARRFSACRVLPSPGSNENAMRRRPGGWRVSSTYGRSGGGSLSNCCG